MVFHNKKEEQLAWQKQVIGEEFAEWLAGRSLGDRKTVLDEDDYEALAKKQELEALKRRRFLRGRIQ
ncbi:MAG: hypothetical protein IMX04_02470 [Candidatus Carbobacillus altaicus]|uniref:Uncharacterized protein n=1 Tax=Candidatus Carbonibacillus altaicus TaxID=2163959 RepID=A0A2R6Y506_9BACL|nr:hypothetical protein [Candidatus Carbobacillus altaicus]PTQ57742.1 MAG: hypothetical protein BSOLF_0937 [Candidatus Carbobacillus altaicus]